jgi:hypothetical protein
MARLNYEILSPYVKSLAGHPKGHRQYRCPALGIFPPKAKSAQAAIVRETEKNYFQTWKPTLLIVSHAT